MYFRPKNPAMCAPVMFSRRFWVSPSDVCVRPQGMDDFLTARLATAKVFGNELGSTEPLLDAQGI